MSEQQLRRCTQCSGNLVEKNGMLVCTSCLRKYELKSDALSNELQEVMRRRQLREFIQAEELCRELAKKMPYNSEVYWQTMLAELGVVYVQEERRAKPTFFSYSYSDKEEIKDNPNFKKCIENCKSAAERADYMEKANELNSLLKEFFSLVDKENSYDVFLSFKQTETNTTVEGEEITRETDDCKKAREIYNYLTKKGYRVFFSPVSIGKDTGIQGEKYEPRILKALQSSQAMILLGTKAKYLTAQWVENEWRRYLFYMDKGRKNRTSLILGYMSNMPALPPALRDTQWPNVDMFNAGYLAELEKMLFFVRRKGGLDTVQIATKVGHKKKTREREVFEQTDLAIVSDTDELTLGVDKQLRLIESDLGTKRRPAAIREFERLKANLQAEGKTDGRVLLLDYAIKCGLKGVDDFKNPSNFRNVNDFGVFKRVIEAGGAKDWLYSVLDMLYGFAASPDLENKKADALEIALPYQYPKRAERIAEILQRSKEKGWSKVFDLVLPRAELSDSEEETAIVEMADSALSNGRFSAARTYCEKILSDYNDGNLGAKMGVILANHHCRTDEDFFDPSRVVDFTEAQFDAIKDFLSYTSASGRITLLDKWNAFILRDFKKKKDRAENIDRYISLDDLNRMGAERLPADPKLAARMKRDFADHTRFIDDFTTFYDKFLAFYPKEEQTSRVLAAAKGAANCGAGQIALHYYNFAVGEAKNKAAIYWDMMLCSLGCKRDNDLYELTVDVTENEYFDKALKTAEGAEFTRIQEIRIKQLDAAENNRARIKAEKAAAAKRMRARKAKLALSVLAAIATAMLLCSSILAFAGVRPFFDIWAMMSYGLTGSFLLLYIGLAVSVVLTLIALIIMIKMLRGRRGTRDTVFSVIAMLLSITLFVGSILISSEAKETAENVVYGKNYIIVLSDTLEEEEKDSKSSRKNADSSSQSGKLYIESVFNLPGATVKIPSEYDDRPISTTFKKGWADRAASMKLVLPDGMFTSITGEMFSGNTKLKGIYIPESVTSIELGAFSGCGKLKEITLPFVGSGTQESGEESPFFGYIFGSGAFVGSTDVAQWIETSSSTSVYSHFAIPSKLKKVTVLGGDIDNGAFNGCNGLKEVNFGANVRSISKLAFEGTYLMETTDGICYVGNNAIGLEKNSTKADPSALKDGVEGLYGALFSGTDISEINLPDSVKTIGYRTFADCTSLKSVTLPDGIETIGYGAFDGCTSLKSVKFPSGVTQIGEKAFSGCGALEAADLPNGLEKIGSQAFKDCVSLGRATIPSGVSSIGSGAFGGCSSLGEISVPASAETIGFGAFENCRALASLTISDGVKTIGSSAFKGCLSLENVDIPASVSYIGSGAFSDCFALKTVNISDKVKNMIISDQAFSSCDAMETVSLPSGVRGIGYGAFEDCNSLTSMVLPFIGSNAHSDRSQTHLGYIFGASSGYSNSEFVPASLKTVIVTSDTEVGDYAFYRCGNIESISLPIGLTVIGEYAFYECESLSNILLPSGVTDIKYQAFCRCVSLKSISIPSGVKEIGEGAFFGCASLASVELPENLELIGAAAFQSCTNLNGVELPDKLVNIGSDAFRGCSSLTSVTVPNAVEYIGDHAFYDCGALTAYCVAGSDYGWSFDWVSTSTPVIWDCENTDADYEGNIYSVIDGVRYRLFADGHASVISQASNIKSASIPASVTYNDAEYAVTDIDAYAFMNCIELTDVEIGSNVESIGSSAFYGCSSLTEIVIPESVISVGRTAFGNNRALTIYCEAARRPLSWDGSWNGESLPVVWDCNNNDKDERGCAYAVIGGVRYRLGDGTAAVTKQPTTLTEAVVAESVTYKGESYEVTGIESGAFGGCKLTSLTLPFIGAYKDGSGNTFLGHVFGAGNSSGNSSYVPTSLKSVVVTGGTSVASLAFANCAYITSIKLPSGMTSIGQSAFSGCSRLASIELPSALTEIGDNAFYICYALNGLTLPDGLERIGGYAFYSCSALADIVIPDSVTYIGNSAFYGCNRLVSARIGNGVSQIRESTFSNCTRLTSVVFPESLSSIANEAFYNCTSLKTIVLPDSVTYIGYNAFSRCTALSEVKLGDSISSIWENAFYNCTALTSVDLGDSVEYIGDSAFYGCTALKRIVIPASVSSMGSNVFLGCESLSIYCEAESEPYNWSWSWNSDCPVVWNYKG